MLSGCTRVGPGYVGIKVSYAGDNRGVDEIPLETGWVFYTPGVSTVFEYPTFVQTAIWTSNPNEGKEGINEEISFNTRDQMQVQGDISVSYTLLANKVPSFYVKFRNDDINGFTHGFLRNVSRDIFNEVSGNYSVEEIMGAEKEAFLNAVRTKLQARMDTIGVHIEQFGFTSSPRPPQNVVEAINNKIAASQKAVQIQNELAQSEGEAKKVVATANGAAEANRILNASITPSLIQWRQLQITEKALEKWNGSVPMVQGSVPNMLFSLPFPKQ
jgi:regulator of protease activity HflC (stomatin/prohibitin superfamily)